MTHVILLNCVEPFVSAIDITMGDEVPVYSRASHSRTAATVVTLLLTATTGAVAREFRAADAQSEVDASAIDLNRAKPVRLNADIDGLRLRVQQSEAISDMIQPLGAGAAMAGSHAEARRDSAAPQPVERIREVE
jgi:hypothetical protein